MLRAPELNTVLTGAEEQNPLPHPAGHTAFDAAQDATGLLGCELTLPAHMQYRL